MIRLNEAALSLRTPVATGLIRERVTMFGEVPQANSHNADTRRAHEVAS